MGYEEMPKRRSLGEGSMLGANMKKGLERRFHSSVHFDELVRVVLLRWWPRMIDS